MISIAVLPYAALLISWAQSRRKRGTAMPVIPPDDCPLCREARRFDPTYVCDSCREHRRAATRALRRMRLG